MNRRFFQLLGVAAVLIALVLILRFARDASTQSASGKAGASATKGPGTATPWGDPDLQGIWTRDSDEPLQRAVKYANKEFLTDEERGAVDKQIAAIVGREADESR